MAPPLSRLAGRHLPAAGDASRWRMLVVLCVALVLSMTTWFSATAVVPELTVRWALSGGQASLLTIAVQIGFVVGAIASGLVNLPDIVPMPVLMTCAALLAALANAALLAAPGVDTAILARLITGASLAGIYPPALKLVSTWFRTGRGLALGAVIAALTLGSASPHLARALGGANWQRVVVATSGATLLGAILLALHVREGPYPFSRAVFNPGQIGRVLRNRAIALANFGYFGHMWELYAMWGWFAVYTRAAIVAPNFTDGARASLLTFVVIASGIAGCLLGGYLADRWSRTATTILMMAVSGASACLIGFVFTGPLWLFAVVGMVWGVAVVGDSAQFSAIVTEVGDPRFVGTALSLQLGIGFALTVGSIWLLPQIALLFGSWRWVFLVLTPGPGLGILAMVLLRRLPDADRIAHGRR